MSSYLSSPSRHVVPVAVGVVSIEILPLAANESASGETAEQLTSSPTYPSVSNAHLSNVGFHLWNIKWDQVFIMFIFRLGTFPLRFGWRRCLHLAVAQKIAERLLQLVLASDAESSFREKGVCSAHIYQNQVFMWFELGYVVISDMIWVEAVPWFIFGADGRRRFLYFVDCWRPYIRQVGSETITYVSKASIHVNNLGSGVVSGVIWPM